MADPDSGLANAALAKIAAGKSLQELSPNEQQVIGSLSPAALEAARKSRIAPKPDQFISTNYEGQSKPLQAGAGEPKAAGAYDPPVTAIDRAYADAVAARDALKPGQDRAACPYSRSIFTAGHSTEGGPRSSRRGCSGYGRFLGLSHPRRNGRSPGSCQAGRGGRSSNASHTSACFGNWQ